MIARCYVAFLVIRWECRWCYWSDGPCAGHPQEPGPTSLCVVRNSSPALLLRSARCAAALVVGCLVSVGVVVLPTGVAVAAPSACGPSFSDPLTATPWPLRRLRPELVWPLTKGDGVTVAVIDSGVSTIHPSLAGQVLSGRDYVTPGGAGDCDEVVHGTFVAGIIAGNRLKDSGFYGMAPGAKILPIRVLKDAEKSADTSVPMTIADAINYAVANGAKVINLSLVTQRVPQLEAAVADAVAKDVVVVAAAGNDGASTGADKTAYPAALPGVIAVAGVDETEKHVSTSTPGEYVDVAAPGVRIDGPAPQGGGFVSRAAGGTSFAAAYVSGVAALIRAYYPKLTAQQIADRITKTADHPAQGRTPELGYGVVNPYRAVTAILDGTGATGAQQSARGISLAEPRKDSLRGVLIAAAWMSFGGALLAVMVLIGGVIARRGKSRSWQPGQALASGNDSENIGIRRRLSFTPVVGRTLNISGPTVHRQGGSEAQRAILDGRRSATMPTTSGLGR